MQGCGQDQFACFADIAHYRYNPYEVRYYEVMTAMNVSIKGSAATAFVVRRQCGCISILGTPCNLVTHMSGRGIMGSASCVWLMVKPHSNVRLMLNVPMHIYLVCVMRCELQCTPLFFPVCVFEQRHSGNDEVTVWAVVCPLIVSCHRCIHHRHRCIVRSSGSWSSHKTIGALTAL